MRGKSLFSDENNPCCFVCHTTIGLHVHHIYGGVGRRPISDEQGCWVYLCGPHHNLSNQGVHFNREMDAYFKRECQRRWMARENATVDDFRAMFYGSYI